MHSFVDLLLLHLFIIQTEFLKQRFSAQKWIVKVKSGLLDHLLCTDGPTMSWKKMLNNSKRLAVSYDFSIVKTIVVKDDINCLFVRKSKSILMLCNWLSRIADGRDDIRRVSEWMLSTTGLAKSSSNILMSLVGWNWFLTKWITEFLVVMNCCWVGLQRTGLTFFPVSCEFCSLSNRGNARHM
jgi:hypothetical protein